MCGRSVSSQCRAHSVRAGALWAQAGKAEAATRDIATFAKKTLHNRPRWAYRPRAGEEAPQQQRRAPPTAGCTRPPPSTPPTSFDDGLGGAARARQGARGAAAARPWRVGRRRQAVSCAPMGPLVIIIIDGLFLCPAGQPALRPQIDSPCANVWVWRQPPGDSLPGARLRALHGGHPPPRRHRPGSCRRPVRPQPAAADAAGEAHTADRRRDRVGRQRRVVLHGGRQKPRHERQRRVCAGARLSRLHVHVRPKELPHHGAEAACPCWTYWPKIPTAALPTSLPRHCRSQDSYSGLAFRASAQDMYRGGPPSLGKILGLVGGKLREGIIRC